MSFTNRNGHPVLINHTKWLKNNHRNVKVSRFSRHAFPVSAYPDARFRPNTYLIGPIEFCFQLYPQGQKSPKLTDDMVMNPSAVDDPLLTPVCCARDTKRMPILASLLSLLQICTRSIMSSMECGRLADLSHFVIETLYLPSHGWT
jgi:hypothetical protein